MTAGMAIGLVGLVVMADIPGLVGRSPACFPAYLCFGISLALVYAPMSTAAMAAMPPSKAGIASGVLAMDRVFAGALLLAISAAVFQATLPAGGLEDGSQARLAASVADALWPAIVVVALATFLTWLLVRSPDRAAPSPEPAELVHHQHHRRFHL